MTIDRSEGMNFTVSEDRRMMTDERHCGYANYETFTVGVVIENDRALITEARAVVKMADEANEQVEGSKSVVDSVRFWVEAKFIDPVCQEGTTHHGIAATLCHAALGRVDWLELADEWRRGEGE